MPIIGKHADTIIMDDPHHPDLDDPATTMVKVREWFDGPIADRLANGRVMREIGFIIRVGRADDKTSEQIAQAVIEKLCELGWKASANP